MCCCLSHSHSCSCINRFLFIFKIENPQFDCCCNCSINLSIVIISISHLILSIPLLYISLILTTDSKYFFALSTIFLIDSLNSIIVIASICCSHEGRPLVKWIYFYNAVRFIIMTIVYLAGYIILVYFVADILNDRYIFELEGGVTYKIDMTSKIIIVALAIFPILFFAILRELYVTWQYYLFYGWRVTGRNDIIRRNILVKYIEDVQVFDVTGVVTNELNLNNIVINLKL